jgi:hypothetical protein
LGLYRIIFAFCALLTVPDITWTLAYPDSFVRFPSGPFRLMTGLPPAPVLIGLEVARCVALVILGIGLWTRLASWAAAFFMSIAYGIGYSLHYQHHTILMVLTPAVLSLAGWGSRFSIDAWRGAPKSAGQTQWPLRLLTLIIALGFCTAAAPKIVGGWLSPATQMVRAYVFAYSFSSHYGFWLDGAATRFQNILAWESLDWFTVILELAFLVAVPRWRSFRMLLALATLLHLGVFLLLGIAFSSNVIAYGAFVSWGSIFSRAAARATVCHPALGRYGPLLLVTTFSVLGLLEIVLLLTRVSFVVPAEVIIVFLGALAGSSYLVWQVLQSRCVRPNRGNADGS